VWLPSVAVSVTGSPPRGLGGDGTLVCPNTVLAGMKKLDGSDAIAGCAAESIIVGPPKSDATYIYLREGALPASDRVEAGNLEVAQRRYRQCRRRLRRRHGEPGMPVRPFVITT